MLVLDASALLELLLGRPGARNIMDEMIQQPRAYVAGGTDLLVLSVLRDYCEPRDTDDRQGRIEEARALKAVEALATLPIERYTLQGPEQARRIWQLSSELPIHSAASIALAESLGARLLTCDDQVPETGHQAQICLVG